MALEYTNYNQQQLVRVPVKHRAVCALLSNYLARLQKKWYSSDQKLRLVLQSDHWRSCKVVVVVQDTYNHTVCSTDLYMT